MRTRAALFAGLLVAGIVILAVAGSTTLQAIGFAVTAVGGVLLVSLAFFEVGRSEDRARAEDERQAAERARAEETRRRDGLTSPRKRDERRR